MSKICLRILLALGSAVKDSLNVLVLIASLASCRNNVATLERKLLYWSCKWSIYSWLYLLPVTYRLKWWVYCSCDAARYGRARCQIGSSEAVNIDLFEVISCALLSFSCTPCELLRVHTYPRRWSCDFEAKKLKRLYWMHACCCSSTQRVLQSRIAVTFED